MSIDRRRNEITPQVQRRPCSVNDLHDRRGIQEWQEAHRRAADDFPKGRIHRISASDFGNGRTPIQNRVASVLEKLTVCARKGRVLETHAVDGELFPYEKRSVHMTPGNSFRFRVEKYT